MIGAKDSGPFAKARKGVERNLLRTQDMIFAAAGHATDNGGTPQAAAQREKRLKYNDGKQGNKLRASYI